MQISTVYARKNPKDGSFFFSPVENRNDLATITLVNNGKAEVVQGVHFISDPSNGGVRASLDIVESIISQINQINQALPVKNTPNNKKTQQKYHKLEVVRYIRPDASVCDDINKYGVTLVFNLDYRARKIDVDLSVCFGDEFNKQEGYRIAKQHRNYIYNLDMPFDIVDHSFTEGLVNWFILRVPDEVKDTTDIHLTDGALTRMLEIYSASRYAL